MDLLRPRKPGEGFSRTCLLDLSSVVLVILSSAYVVLKLWLVHVVSIPCAIVIFLKVHKMLSFLIVKLCLVVNIRNCHAFKKLA